MGSKKDMPATSKPSQVPESRREFHRRFLEEARKVEWGGINPVMALAVSDLETGGGQNNLTKKANNLFSLRVGSGWKTGGWRGATYQAGTSGEFRAYDAWADSMKDFARLLTFGLYAKARAAALSGDFKTFAKELKAAGYDATSPQYADHLVSRYNAISATV